jgi:hypothetical protein
MDVALYQKLYLANTMDFTTFQLEVWKEITRLLLEVMKVALEIVVTRVTDFHAREIALHHVHDITHRVGAIVGHLLLHSQRFREQILPLGNVGQRIDDEAKVLLARELELLLPLVDPHVGCNLDPLAHAINTSIRLLYIVADLLLVEEGSHALLITPMRHSLVDHFK